VIHRCRAIVALSIVVAIAAACSTDRPDSDAGASNPDVAAGGGLTRAEVTALLTTGLYDTVKADALLQECMAASGFLWIAASAASPPASLAADAAFAQTYGYGIATGALVVAEEPGEPDPNLAYFSGLSASAQAAYNRALVGNEQGVAPISEESCLGRENAALAVQAAIAGSPVAAQILEEYQEAIDADPAVVAEGESWRRCMADRGHDVSSTAEIVTGLQGDVELATSPEELKAIAARELAIAGDDYACAGDLRGAVEAITPALVEQLVDRFGT
jgi:hypothetical protein